MFTIESVPFGSAFLLKMQDGRSGSCATILPTYGCRLHQLHFGAGDKQVPVLRAADTFDLFLAQDTKAYSGALLFPYVDRVAEARYSFDEKSYALTPNDATGWHALHGFIDQHIFSVESTSADGAKAMVHCQLAYRGEEQGYPFPCRVDVELKLTSQQLTCKTSITNTGKSKMPVAVGWHPYFQLTPPLNDYCLHIPAVSRFSITEDYLNTGIESGVKETGPISVPLRPGLFECYRLQPNQACCVQLSNKKAQTTISLVTTTDEKGFPFLQVYVPEEGNAVALEPLTAIGNAFNNGIGLCHLAPGNKIEKSFAIGLDEYREN